MNKKSFFIFTVFFGALLAGCKQSSVQPENRPYTTVGDIVRLSPKLDALVPPNAKIEILGEGYSWSEGPVWVETHNMLLFSDVPKNIIYRWRETDGVTEYLIPSGHTGITEGGSEGSNGLLLDSQNRLVICQHGDRRMAYMDAPLTHPESKFVSIADNYQEKKFNSPNDAAFHSSGALYFTDPPYGLSQGENSPHKELPYQGVFRATPGGEVALLTDKLSRPNGIAFSPDEQTLYVANSDPENAIWMAYDVTKSGDIENPRLFFDATEDVPNLPGLPDGLKIDDAGNLFATGPGGVLIFTPEGEHLGTINTGQKTANVAFNEDKSILYMTAHSYLMRIVLR